jgi:hypothetical protein
VSRGVAEVFDPATNKFADAGAFVHAPRSLSALVALPNGVAAIIGGERLDSIEVWDPAKRTWKVTARLAVQRAGHTATVLGDSRVLVVGGSDEKFTEICDLAAGTCKQVGTLAMLRSDHVAVRLADGRVLICGGHTGRGATAVTTDSIEVFDGTTWKQLGRMRKPRSAHAAALLPDGSVLVTGGCAEDCPATHRDAEIIKP